MDNWVGAAFGLCFTSLAAASLWRGTRARNWPTTAGRVIEIAVVKNLRGSKSLQVRYEYEVGGIRYTADRLTFGLLATNSPNKVVVKARSLKSGDSVLVHYNPGQPAHAALELGVTFTTFWFLALGLALLMTSVGPVLGLSRTAP